MSFRIIRKVPRVLFELYAIKSLFSIIFFSQERYNTFQPEWKNILPNTTLLSEVFTDLKFGTTFQIMPVLSLAKTEIHGSWKTVDTLCDRKLIFPPFLRRYLLVIWNERYISSVEIIRRTYYYVIDILL